MEENENKQEPSINTDELKNETVNTVNQVKETMKNVNVKEEAKVTKGFIAEMLKNPLGKIKEIANDTTNQCFKTAIILVIVWMLTKLILIIDFDVFEYFTWKYFGKLILTYVKTTIAPAILVIVMSTIIFIMNKKSKKSLTTVISTIVATKLPVIAASVISLLTVISSNIVNITSKISSFASILSTVLLYIGIRELYNEEDEKQSFKTFVIIEAIYVVVSFIISYLGIYI